MEHFVPVALFNSIEQLVEVFLETTKHKLEYYGQSSKGVQCIVPVLCVCFVLLTYLDLQVIKWLLAVVEQLLQILIEILEDQGQLSVRVQYIDEAHDVWVLEFLEKGYFTDGCRRDSLVLRLETNLLQRVYLIGVGVSRLVDNTVGSLTDNLDLLILINLGLHVSFLTFFLPIILFANKLVLIRLTLDVFNNYLLF
jgi:hypothetical protein